MATFTTTRQRTLGWSGTLTGYISIYVSDLGPEDEFYYRSSEFRRDFEFGWIEAYGMITDGVTENKINDPTGIVPADATHIFVRCTAHNYFDSTETTTDSTQVAIGSSGLFEIAFAGSFAVSVQVEQCGSTAALDSGIIDSDGFPTYGGSAAKDGLPGRAITWFEQTRAAGTYSLSITAAGATATESGTCGSNRTQDYRCEQMNYCQCYGGGFFEGLSSSTYSFLDASFPISVYESRGSGGTLEEISADGTDILTHTGSGGANGDPLEARIYVDYTPPYWYWLAGRIRTMETRGLGVWQGRWTHALLTEKNVNFRPEGADVESQVFYTWIGVLGDETIPGTDYNDLAANRIYLLSSGLTSNRDDTRDWRILFAGVRWQVASLSHASSTSVDEGASTTGWSNDANTTITTTGGAINLAVAGGTGSVTRTLTSAIWEAYRYLTLKARCTTHSSQPMRVEVGTKTWDITTNATLNTYDEVILDLLCPHNTTEDADGQDSRFPLAGVGGAPLNEGELWGINQPATVKITNLADGKTYEIDWIRLTRAEWARGWFIPSFQEWIVRESGGNYDIKPFGLADVDGRTSAFEITDMIRDRSGSPTVYTYRTITNAIADIAAITGWTCTASGSAPDSWHTSSLEAQHIAGGGATVTTSAGVNTWTDWIDYDATSATLYAQSLFDEVTAFPLCGNVWDYSASWPSETAPEEEKACPLRFTKILRGQAIGCVFRDTDVPWPSADIVVYETSTPANSSGTGVTGARGEYQSGATFGRGNVGQTIELREGSSPFLSLTDTFQNRRRYRSSFREAADTAAYPSVDVGLDDTRVHSFIRGGTIWTGWASVDLAWNDTDTGISADTAKVRFMRDNLDRELALIYGDGTNIKLAYSADLGVTFGVSTTIGTGDHCCIEIARHGEQYIYWRDGTALKGTVLDAQGNTIQATFTVVASGVDDSALDAREQFKAEGEWSMILTYIAGGSVITITSPNGKDFT